MSPLRFEDADALAREIIDRLGHDLRVALPLGLGKPVTLLNALTRAAVADPSIRLSIFTALTLERPEPASDLEHRFLAPARDRLFGRYPQIDYAHMLRDGSLPGNIDVREFFFMAGRWLDVAAAQRNYVSVNYAHALRVLLSYRPNLILQLLAREGDRVSLSCNTDISADLFDLRRRGAIDLVFAGEINPQLPFLGADAAIAADEADFLLEPPEPFELFSAVKQPVGNVEHAIGLHVSRLIPDGGTLQVGIGTIGDAVANALLVRHEGGISAIHDACPFPQGDFGEADEFREGLYAVTEMLVDGLLQLFEAGIVRREVDGAAIHAGFFLDTRDFYARLRDMPPERRAKISMKPVSFTNSLLGDEPARRVARRDARFVNAAMKVTLLGAVMSDTTDDGRVVSGVGGQHDFVTQAWQLDGGRSVITLPATRQSRGSIESNIVWEAGMETIPRHLRDIVVTEYGIADLRGKSDAEAILSMIAIADSRFQERLLDQARAAGKLPAEAILPARHRSNSARRVAQWLGRFRSQALPDFPFGTDFTDTEQRLLPALSRLSNARHSKARLAKLVVQGSGGGSPDEEACIRRMNLAHPHGVRERLRAAALRGALRAVAD